MNFKLDHQMFLILNGVIGGLVVASLMVSRFPAA